MTQLKKTYKTKARHFKEKNKKKYVVAMKLKREEIEKRKKLKQQLKRLSHYSKINFSTGNVAFYSL